MGIFSENRHISYPKLNYGIWEYFQGKTHFDLFNYLRESGVSLISIILTSLLLVSISIT